MRLAPDHRSRTARWGERLAELWLRAKGYRIVARNWRCALGELDLVCADGQVLVFVEVKTRRSMEAGRPEEAVTGAKQRRLVRLAQAYLGERKVLPPCRFDIVAVDWSRWLPRLRHLKAAFRAWPSA
ncbi:MAG: YraN family protein [Thermoanaerobaculaceae bacterium]|nr:YraN family protein [Thermoanaerobaculaceae bacterium]